MDTQVVCSHPGDLGGDLGGPWPDGGCDREPAVSFQALVKGEPHAGTVPVGPTDLALLT